MCIRDRNQSFGNFFIEEDFSDGTIRFVGAGVSRVDGVSEVGQMDVLGPGWPD